MPPVSADTVVVRPQANHTRPHTENRTQAAAVRDAGEPHALHLRSRPLTISTSAQTVALPANAMNESIGAAAPPQPAPITLDGFLASVEKRAFVMAKYATGDADAALDIVQESMYRLVERYRDREPTEWAPLFFTIVQRQIADHHRPRGITGRLKRWFGDAGNEIEATEQLAASNADPGDVADADALGNHLVHALERLPERQRQVFMLRQWQGLSVEQTASALGISVGSVKTHLSRALAHLRQRLPEDLT